MTPSEAARHAATGTLAARLLEAPIGLLDLLGRHSDALHVVGLERAAGERKRDREGTKP